MAKNEQKKRLALAALMESSTLTEAAEKAGISRRSLYTYIRGDNEFARAYRDLQEMYATAAAESAEARAEEAASVVDSIMRDEAQPAAIRLKAAQIVLETSAKRREKLEGITQKAISDTSALFDFSL